LIAELHPGVRQRLDVCRQIPDTQDNPVPLTELLTTLWPSLQESATWWQLGVVASGVLLALWVANRKVYGAHKLWKAARRAGVDIGRDQVARLMRHAGIEGVRRRRRVFTTRRDAVIRARDLHLL